VAAAYVDTEDGRAALAAAARMAVELQAELQVVSVLPDTRVAPSMGEPSIYRNEEQDVFRSAGGGEQQPARWAHLEYAAAPRARG